MRRYPWKTVAAAVMFCASHLRAACPDFYTAQKNSAGGSSLAAADFNYDGNIDIAAIAYEAPQVFLLFNKAMARSRRRRVTLSERGRAKSSRPIAPRNVVPRARVYVEKALQLDDSVAEAHELMAEILLEYDWKWPDAERELQRAMALDPNLARSYVEYGTLLVSAGRIDEGLCLSARAAALDPVGTLQRWDPPYQLYVARRWSEMIAEAQRELDLDPRYGYAYAILGLADLERGDREDALRAAAKTIALTNGTFSRSLAAYVDAGAGRPDLARDLVGRIEKISETRWVCFFNVAAIYAALGEKDKAFASLERAVADRSG